MLGLNLDSHLTMRLSFTFGREAYRAALILIEEGAISRAGFNGPYEKSSRQVGFVNYGVSHVMRLVGSAELAQRASWYQKWNVHMFTRPEVRSHYLCNRDHKRRCFVLFNLPSCRFDGQLSSDQYPRSRGHLFPIKPRRLGSSVLSSCPSTIA